MNTDIVTPTWIAARINEAEFQEFVGATTAEDAIKKATAKCLNGEAEICTSRLATLKECYLSFCRTKWGLPAAAGNTL